MFSVVDGGKRIGANVVVCVVVVAKLTGSLRSRLAHFTSNAIDFFFERSVLS